MFGWLGSSPNSAVEIVTLCGNKLFEREKMKVKLNFQIYRYLDIIYFLMNYIKCVFIFLFEILFFSFAFVSFYME